MRAFKLLNLLLAVLIFTAPIACKWGNPADNPNRPDDGPTITDGDGNGDGDGDENNEASRWGSAIWGSGRWNQ